MHINKSDQRGIGHLIIFAAIPVILIIGFVGFRVAHGHTTSPKLVSGTSTQTSANQQYHPNPANTNSLDPVTKGQALTYGKCDGTGTTTLTHAPMDTKDVSTIAPEGGFGGAHVTPIDHQYYYGLNQRAAPDTYPVYAVMDGNINAVGYVSGQKTSWNLTLSHSCTFMAYYNLMTSLASGITSKLPSNWKQISGNVKIPVKAGDIIGYSGGQSLDFQLVNTQTTLKGLLYPTAYNNAEPIKINGVRPLDYFSSSVKTAILPKYLRQIEPRDGRYDYDVSGEAVGNWFKVGTNGYAGTTDSSANQGNSSGHLSLAYDSFNPSTLVFSIGDYQGQPQEFAVKGNVDWTKVTTKSGVTKVQLAQGSLQTADGSVWNGGYVSGGITYVATTNLATALIQLTDTNELKVELFPGKIPDQISGFTAAAVMYDRGQDAKLVGSSTQSH